MDITGTTGIPVLMPAETEPRTVDGVTLLHGADGWVLNYSGKPASLKDKSFAVRCVDYKTVKRRISETWTPREYTRLVRTLKAREAMKRRDWFSVLNEYGLNPSEPLTDAELSAAATKVQLKTSSEITKGVRRARVVIWARQQPRPEGWPRLMMGLGLFCPDLTTAAFILEALDKLRACPRCEQLFQPTRPKQTYCSPGCRDTFNKRRSRARVKAKQGGK